MIEDSSGGYRLKGRAQSVHERSDVGKIVKSSYLRAPKELEAHILRNRSTGEYYQHTKYERLTPSELGDRVIFRFGPVVFLKTNPTTFSSKSQHFFLPKPSIFGGIPPNSFTRGGSDI